MNSKCDTRYITQATDWCKHTYCSYDTAQTKASTSSLINH